MKKLLIVAALLAGVPAQAAIQCDPDYFGGVRCYRTQDWREGIPQPQIPTGQDFDRAINGDPWGVPLPFQRR